MYSREAQTQFIKSKLCHDDPVLFKLYAEAVSPGATELQRKKFRRRLGDKDVSEAVQTFMTNECRPLIHRAVKVLGDFMKPMGKMIITGGEAFNEYLPKQDRVVTTDIDTKFCPLIYLGKTSEGVDEVLTPRQQPDYFEALQITKLLMWDRLGKLTQQINAQFNRCMSRLAKSPVGKLLMIRPVMKPLRRRFTLIPKKKQGTGSAVKEGDVLIDVELFAMDAKIKYLGKLHNVGGMLDIAFMRPMEIGYDVVFNTKRTKEGLEVAGKEFLVTDLFMMQTLKLRPQKADKDRKRMYTFAKFLGVKNVSPSDSITKLFLKSLPKAKRVFNVHVKRSMIYDRNALLRRALAVNVRRYPTSPSFSSLGRCVSNVPRRGFKATSGEYVFDEHDRKWKKDMEGFRFGPASGSGPEDWYIRNMAKYRGDSPSPSSSSPWNWSAAAAARKPPPRCTPTLYGYNPDRDARIPKKLIQKAKVFL